MTHIIESLLARTTKKVLNRKYKQKCGLSNKADKVIKYCKSAQSIKNCPIITSQQDFSNKIK